MYKYVTPPLPHWEEDHSYRKKPVNSTVFHNSKGRRPSRDTNIAQSSEGESAVSVLHWRKTQHSLHPALLGLTRATRRNKRAIVRLLSAFLQQ